MRVAVVGAGVSGLAAIKCCRDEGLDVVCFERRNDLGGLWNYTETVEPGQSNVTRFVNLEHNIGTFRWQQRNKANTILLVARHVRVYNVSTIIDDTCYIMYTPDQFHEATPSGGQVSYR